MVIDTLKRKTADATQSHHCCT